MNFRFLCSHAAALRCSYSMYEHDRKTSPKFKLNLKASIKSFEFPHQLDDSAGKRFAQIAFMRVLLHFIALRLL